MSDKKMLKVGFLSPNDDRIRFKEVDFSNSESYDKEIVSVISPTGNIDAGIMNLNEDLEIHNFLILFDNEMSTNKGEYNFTHSISPLFGEVAFVKFGYTGDNMEPVSMLDDEAEVLSDIIYQEKTSDRAIEFKEKILEEVRIYGKDGFLRKYNESIEEAQKMYEDNFSEEEEK
ncbi:hypothetical protein FPHOBKDP_00217 [Listeria phage LPJP1]|nr:hypothetical protein FPHOBKDP_00217 [Listeria phage LPJP1]